LKPLSEGKVVYMSKDGKKTKIFPALEWLAAMCAHIPNRGEQMVRYYDFYSNVARGKRKEAGTGDDIPCILDVQRDNKTFRQNWARLIQKIYEVDPLVCPKCQGAMRVISSIEDPYVIRAILAVGMSRQEGRIFKVKRSAKVIGIVMLIFCVSLLFMAGCTKKTVSKDEGLVTGERKAAPAEVKPAPAVKPAPQESRELALRRDAAANNEVVKARKNRI